MRATTTWCVTAVVCVTWCVSAVGAEKPEPTLRFANIFNDHLVLQRDKPVKIWGWAQPGAKVTVVLTESRQEAVKLAGEESLKRPEPAKSPTDEKPYRVRFTYEEENAPPFSAGKAEVTADAAGLWQTTLEPLSASFKPKFLLAVSGDRRAALRDVLVGEVWVCAGQSNMFSSANKTKWLDSEGLLPPGVRYAHTGRASDYRPRTDLVERVTWRPCVEDNTRGISTIPYLFGKYLHRRLQVPVGIINAASGGAQGNYWCSLEELHKIDFPAVKEIMAEHDKAVAAWEDPQGRKRVLAEYEKQYAEQLAQWEKDAASAKAAKKRPPRKPEHRPPGRPRSRFLAAYLYNARIAPIGRLPIRGVLYLQGEQQVLTWSIDQYESVFPAVLRSFRSAFGDAKLPFGIITLQGNAHSKGNVGAVDMVDRYAVIRDMHYRTHLKTPNTGFICAHDVGLGLHPSWKRPLGERAAHWALRDVYKQVPTGHVSVGKIEFKDGRAKVQIVRDQIRRKRGKNRTWTEELVKTPVGFRVWSGNDTHPLSGFMIAGADRRWYPAKIRCLPKERELEVWSDLVAKPVALRYGWGGYPNANLGDWEDPLAPFRTDDWPLPQASSHKGDIKTKYRSEWYKQLGIQYSNSLDRTIRQGRIDAAICEMKLHRDGQKIFQSKANRISAILDEMAPAFYEGPRLQWVNDRDWKLRREDERRLREAENVPAQIKDITTDKAVAASIENLRKALAQFRKAVNGKSK